MVASTNANLMVGNISFDLEGSYASCFDPCDPGPHPERAPSRLKDDTDVLLCHDFPSPPYVVNEYYTYYRYSLNPVIFLGVCGYSVCSGQAFLSSCPSSFVVNASSCNWLGAVQYYRITLWSDGYIQCTKSGLPSLHNYIPPCSIP